MALKALWDWHLMELIKKANWLVIEEKSRKAIGFEELVNRRLLSQQKSVYPRLKEDLEGLASKIKPLAIKPMRR